MDVDDDKDNAETTIQDQIANTFESIPSDVNLRNITENKVDPKSIRVLKFDTAGFPKALRRDVSVNYLGWHIYNCLSYMFKEILLLAANKKLNYIFHNCFYLSILF